MTAQPAPRSGLPILGQLSPLSRIFLIGTVVLSLLAIVLDFGLHADQTVLFIVSAAAILGLAWVVGLSTERLGSITGPQVGGILNATFGNIAELIIAFFALQAGLIEVVKASLTGSIIGNLLLVLGAERPDRRPQERLAALQRQDRRLERGAARAGPHRAVRAGHLRADDPRPDARHDHRGIGARGGRPDHRLRPVADLPVHAPGRHARRPRRGRRARRAGLVRSDRDRRAARRGGPAGRAVRDPGRRSIEPFIEHVRPVGLLRRRRSSSRPSATSPSTSCRSSSRPRTRWSSRWP